MTSAFQKCCRDVDRGHVSSQITHIGQISIFFNSRQIVPQNVALEKIVSKKVSLEVNRGHERSKIAKPIDIGLILNFIERRELWKCVSLKLNKGHMRSEIIKNLNILLQYKNGFK